MSPSLFRDAISSTIDISLEKRRVWATPVCSGAVARWCLGNHTWCQIRCSWQTTDKGLTHCESLGPVCGPLAYQHPLEATDLLVRSRAGLGPGPESLCQCLGRDQVNLLLPVTCLLALPLSSEAQQNPLYFGVWALGQIQAFLQAALDPGSQGLLHPKMSSLPFGTTPFQCPSAGCPQLHLGVYNIHFPTCLVVFPKLFWPSLPTLSSPKEISLLRYGHVQSSLSLRGQSISFTKRLSLTS